MNIDFKSRLKAREVLLGTLVTLGNPEIAELMSQIGFDWIWIEMEHAPTDLIKAQTMIQAVAGRKPCLVRVPWNDAVWLKRVLDLGCDGVVIPQIRAATEAVAAVAACQYPPQGVRSIGIARAQNYGINVKDYLSNANDRLSIVLQIEHREAVQNIDEILAVSGIDALLIGPFDLSASMGLPGRIDHPEVEEAMQIVKSACLSAGMPIGVFATDSKKANQQIKDGCTLIALGTDMMYMWKGAQQAIAEIVP